MDATNLPQDVQSLTLEHNGSTIPIHEHPFVKNTPDLPTFFKRAIETNAEVDRRVRLPGKDAKPDDVKGFWNRIKESGAPIDPDFAKSLRNVPADLKEYAYEKPAEIPAGLEWDDSLVETARQWAHEQGLSKEQFSAAVTFWNNIMLDNINVFNGNPAESEASLKQKWGGDYEKNWTLANEGAAKFFNGNDELAQAWAQSGLALRPEFAEKMMEYALATSEDGGIRPSPTASSTIDDQIRAITEPGSEKFKLWQAGDPKINAELQALYNKKHPGMASLS